jgi:hypothetical protein
MVGICDRLLTLMTGKAPLEGIDKDIALDAIELLMQLESWLKHSASAPLPPLGEEALALLRHRVRVLEHLQPVIELLATQGWLPISE